MAYDQLLTVREAKGPHLPRLSRHVFRWLRAGRCPQGGAGAAAGRQPATKVAPARGEEVPSTFRAIRWTGQRRAPVLGAGLRMPASRPGIWSAGLGRAKWKPWTRSQPMS